MCARPDPAAIPSARRAARGALLAAAGAVALVSCLEATNRGPGIFCDAKNPCLDPAYPSCDPVRHECLAPPDLAVEPADLGVEPADLGVEPADLSVGPDLAGCSSSAGCDPATPVCQPDRTCRACQGAADDGACAVNDPKTPRCDATSGRCGACRAATQSTDCGGTTPICDGSTCRACRMHDECPSLVCGLDGSCLPAAQVTYVDNREGACSGRTHAGTSGDPYCEIVDAVGSEVATPAIRVAGRNQAYQALVLAPPLPTYQFVGPGRLAHPTAKINGASSGAVALNGTSAVLDGFELSGGSGAGIACISPVQGASLTVRRTSIHDAGQVAIKATNCPLAVDESALVHNIGGGILIANGTYAITNTFLNDNGPNGPAIQLDDSSSGRISFSTVVNNTGSPSVICSAFNFLQQKIETSIIWGNRAAYGSQFSNCQVSDTVVGSDPVAGGIVSDPVFVSNAPLGDFHLVPNNPCCIDKIANATNDHDVDDDHRPQGKAWDIGADEVVP